MKVHKYCTCCVISIIHDTTYIKRLREIHIGHILNDKSNVTSLNNVRCRQSL